MSRDFDGSTGELTIPPASVLRPSLPVTIAAWINPDALVAGGGVFTSNQTGTINIGASLQLNNTSGNIEAKYGSGGSGSGFRRSKATSGAAAVTTGSWQHIACCIRGATDMDIYIAGSDAGGAYSGTGGAMAHNASTGSRIGRVGGIRFDGRIAEVGFWDVSLSAAEVLAMAKGVSPSRIRPGSLLGHWPLWAVADPDIDLSANGNVASLVGTAPVADHAPIGSPFPVAA